MIEIDLTRDKSKVRLSLKPGDENGELIFTREQFLALIQQLGMVHAEMQIAEGPPPPLTDATIQAMPWPEWHVTPEPLTNQYAFAFHHIGFGPVAFVIPREQVAHMVQLLSEGLEAGPIQFGPAN